MFIMGQPSDTRDYAFKRLVYEEKLWTGRQELQHLEQA